MSINIFYLAGYTPNVFQYESLNKFESIDIVLSEESEKDWDNPLFHRKSEMPKPWVEYRRQLATNGKLLTIDDPIFNNHWREYHLWADELVCDCKENDKTEWCFCEDNKSKVKCPQW
jgi:hypothetical protein